MDEVKKLLEGFAEGAATGLPPADIDADIARGRRALRRIKRRRRVTGVLCVAAASAAVLAFGNQVKWWGSAGDAPVAAGGASEPSASAAGSAEPSAKDADGTVTLFSGGVQLAANQQTWNTIGCTLAPVGWAPEKPIAAGRVVLAQPEMRTAEVATKVVLERREAALSLKTVRVVAAEGKTFHFGTLAGRPAGQVKLADQWLVVEAPAGAEAWNDDTLRRFLGSCTIN